ncbi:MAG TPA: methylated-DNA--[protein]-cysteine S-methyltransferase [Solirubrobacteraceae bacterium]|jgi:methylated-DNA-[protein]-cysteine S-methyltransferase|nr:methylated-DNA--[protein]-cysteine S-methyltransferase [Solirubrobacteraceae bacterium]
MSTQQELTIYESPLGPLTLRAGAAGLTGLYFPGGEFSAGEDRSTASPLLRQACEQLDEYFAGERQRFELELDLPGTEFQLSVWQALRAIPYGATISYSTLATRLGRLDRLRAAAAAVGRTPVPIVVPCHRVIGADGSLTGYGGGLDRKAALLDLERRGVRGEPPEPTWAFRQLALALPADG